MAARRIKNPVLFICDLQDKFRAPINHFNDILATTHKLLRVSQALKVPVIATTQLRAKLGKTCPELELGSTFNLAADVDKSTFSMWIPDVQKALEKLPPPPIDPQYDTKTGKHGSYDIILVGIETHICVLQTTLDALRAGNRVYVVQDGVSSCNAGERGVALERMRKEGATITTSESLLYELMGDAQHAAFKDVAKIVKETKESTKSAVEALCKI